MKKALITILALTLVSGCLSACGKEKEDDIVRIEASNAAGNATGEEREYEDTNKEPVVRPDQRQPEEEVEQNTNEAEQVENIDWTPSVYGVWSTANGDNITLYNSPVGAKFTMFDTSINNYIGGDAETDGSTYVEITYIDPTILEQQRQEREALAQQQQTEENVEGETPEGETSEGEVPEEEGTFVNPYGTDEEYYKALEEERLKQYKTDRYTVGKLEYDEEASIAYLTLTSDAKTFEFQMLITTDTEDYSSPDNSIAKDMIVDENDESYDKKEEEVE